LKSNENQMRGLYERRIEMVSHALEQMPLEERAVVAKELEDYIRKNPKAVGRLEEVYRKDGKIPPDLSKITPQQMESGSGNIPQNTPMQYPHSGPAGDVNPTTVPQASILDYFGQAAGQIGAAVSTVGHVAFDAAIGLGKETLNQTIRLALSQGAGGKAMVKQAAQMAVGNMLASMHAQVMAQVMRDPRIPVGIAPDSPLDTVPRGSIEDVMNSPRNQGVFDQIAGAVQRLLGQFTDLDPSTVMTDQVLKHIREGDLKIPHGVVLPDIFAMDHKHPKDGKGTSAGGHHVEIFGIQLPIRLPEIGGFDGKIDENPDAGKMPGGGNGGLFAFRNADGMVQVSGYNRGGSNVRSHTRSKPDGDVTNNLSYRSKA